MLISPQAPQTLETVLAKNLNKNNVISENLCYNNVIIAHCPLWTQDISKLFDDLSSDPEKK